MIDVQVDQEAASRSLDDLGKRVYGVLVRAVTAQTLALEQFIKADELEGQILHSRTGDLIRSIHSDVEENGSEIVGRVYSDGSVKYAAVHEYGLTIDHPGGTPYLVTSAGAVFVSKAAASAIELERGYVLPLTKAHKIPMPERSFMRRALDERGEAIATAIAAELQKALAG